MEEEFLAHLSRIGSLPYLFLGSGFSKRYIGMESWEDLLEAIAKQIPLPKPFTYYLTESTRDYPLLGSMISDAFYEIFYDTDYQKTYPYITEEILKAGNKDTILKYFIAKYIDSKPMLTSLSEETDLLKKAKVAGVITTNWDNLPENIFPDFKTFIGQEMMFAEALSFGEIFKIHGSVASPDTMVLTQRDYEDYHLRYAYLAAKLLTIFVEHPVIFIGYSLSDNNILNIINSIFACIKKSDHDKFKDRLIFVEFDPNAAGPSLSDGTLSVSNGTFLPIKHIKAKDYTPIYNVLTNLQQTIPTKILVRLKDMLYDFVVSNKPNEKIYVGDINNIDDSMLDKIQAVFGVGAGEMFEFGYRSIGTEDIFRDILSETNKFDTDKLLSLSYPSVFKNIGYIPIYKYLSIKGINSLDDIRVSYPSFSASMVNKLKRINFNTLLPSSSYASHRETVNRSPSFSHLTTRYDDWHVLLYVQLLEHSKINLEELKVFLLRVFDAFYSKTDFRKAVCLYDLLKYKNEL